MTDAMYIDISTMHRMPVGAMNITSHSEKSILEKKQIVYSLIDSCVLAVCLAFFFTFDEKVNTEDLTQHMCKLNSSNLLSIIGICLAFLSLMIDLYTLKQVRNWYVSAFTSLFGLIVDIGLMYLWI